MRIFRYSIVFCNRFVYECFVINIRLLLNTRCWFHCVDIFYIKFRFCETVTIIHSVTRILLIETQYINLELFLIDLPYTYTRMFYVSINSNVLYVPLCFLAFHILLIKTLEICTLFQPIKLQVFCILMIINMVFFNRVFFYFLLIISTYTLQCFHHSH